MYSTASYLILFHVLLHGLLARPRQCELCESNRSGSRYSPLDRLIEIVLCPPFSGTTPFSLCCYFHFLFLSFYFKAVRGGTPSEQWRLSCCSSAYNDSSMKIIPSLRDRDRRRFEVVRRFWGDYGGLNERVAGGLLHGIWFIEEYGDGAPTRDSRRRSREDRGIDAQIKGRNKCRKG